MHSLVDPLQQTIRRALRLATTTVLPATHANHVNAISTEIPGDFDTRCAGGQGAIPRSIISVGGIDYPSAVALQPNGNTSVNRRDYLVSQRGTLVAR